MGSAIPQHLSLTNEHPTPSHVVELARTVMGGIDLDPASSAAMNERVKAERYIGLPDDGLLAEWHGRVFLNPPGGAFVMTKKLRATMAPELADALAAQWSAEAKRWQTKSRACAWWRKLCEEYAGQHTPEGIFLGFTVELLRSAQGTDRWAHPFDFVFCVPRERLCFGGDQPTHANVIVYLGDKPERFVEVFSSIGRCK